MMRPIPISLPTFYDQEVETISALLDAGAHIIHIRKLQSTENELRKLLDKLHNFSKLTLHYDIPLACEYGFGGVHQRVGQTEKGFRNSCSCHTYVDVEQAVDSDYVFLSPVFDSVSKQGYKAAFEHGELKSFVKQSKTKIVALGGVTPENIAEIGDYGFETVAVIGSLWEIKGNKIDLKKTVENYKKLSDAWTKIDSNYNL